MPPRLARLLALVVAAALVGGAFVVRGVLAGDDEEVSAGGSAGGGSSTALRVVCDEDLGDACDALADLDGVREVTTLSAEEAASALTAGDDTHDAWVTLDPVPDVAAVRVAVRSGARAPAPSEDATPIGSSRLAVVVAEQDPRRLQCPGPVSWECVTDERRSPPVGLPDPRTALGALALGHAAAGLLGTTDLGIDDASGEVEARLALALGAADGRTATQLRSFLDPGRFSAVVTSEHLGEVVGSTARGQQRDLRVLPLADAPTIGVVVVPWAGADPTGAARLADALLEGDSGQTVRDALADAGWGGEPARSSGLPDPDVIYALQEEHAR